MKKTDIKILIWISAISGFMALMYFTFNFAVIKLLKPFLYNTLAVIIVLFFAGSVALSLYNYLKGSNGKKGIIPLIINFSFALLVLLSLWITPLITEKIYYNATRDVRSEVISKYNSGELSLKINKITELPDKYSDASDLGKIYLVSHNNIEMILFFRSNNISQTSSECYIYTHTKPNDANEIDKAKIKKDYGDNWYYGVYYW